MFEMKNESDETATKKNEDFLKELDKDCNEKECEYQRANAEKNMGLTVLMLLVGKLTSTQRKVFSMIFSIQRFEEAGITEAAPNTFYNIMENYTNLLS